jgi:hypothetical protein
LLLTGPYDRVATDDRLGEDAPEGKWDGWAGRAGGWGRPASGIYADDDGVLDEDHGRSRGECDTRLLQEVLR